ncbi:hypothetical protein DdX_10123 [Ditylenchus destructor]|uniref:Uncharacterized protein n=1 Tax=Ditylenchus destructor TaxID=166010 RepID=A0AAD4MZW5_9BILA|nr:hypothetical protein DdX_10123 [Ditylenchus destructor]
MYKYEKSETSSGKLLKELMRAGKKRKFKGVIDSLAFRRFFSPAILLLQMVVRNNQTARRLEALLCALPRLVVFSKRRTLALNWPVPKRKSEG